MYFSIIVSIIYLQYFKYRSYIRKNEIIADRVAFFLSLSLENFGLQFITSVFKCNVKRRIL